MDKESPCPVAEIKVAFNSLQLPEIKQDDSAADDWIRNMHRLQELIIDSRNLNKFLCWDVICKTMFTGSRRKILPEYEYLKGLDNWKAKWRPAVREDRLGRPKRFRHYPLSSPNRLHMAYSLALYEDKIGKCVARSGRVLEFGGGYGCMARVIHNLGFCGQYIIFDLEPFSLLQCFYLKSLGLNILSLADAMDGHAGVFCTSNIDEIGKLLKYEVSGDSLFLATWSYSEAPLEVRRLLLPLLSGFSMFLIGYQEKFHEIDNVRFFNEWKTLYDVQWNDVAIPHLHGSRYLFA